MPVWFLPNSFDVKDYTRTIFIPSGAAILWAGPGNVTFDVPGNRTEAQLREENQAGTKEWLASFTVLDVSVDGVPIPDLKQYVPETPLFTIVLPSNNLLGVPVSAGKDQRVAAVAQGYFFMLPPLSMGKHVILFRLERLNPDNGKTEKLTYTHNIVVLDPNDPLP
jgi:hypothetical protein